MKKIMSILAVGLMTMALSTQAFAWGASKDKNKDLGTSQQSSSSMTDKGTITDQDRFSNQGDLGSYDQSNKSLDQSSDMGSQHQFDKGSQSKSSSQY